MARFGHVVLGGTFDRLHVGHEALLGGAFRVGRHVAIGLTSDAYLATHPKPDGHPMGRYRTRRAALARWLARRYPRTRWRIARIDDPFGASIGPGFDALVVTPETARGGRAVNAERRRRGLRPLPVVTIPLVLADDLRPVSSRRVRAGEIDRRGHRRTAFRVLLGTKRTADEAPARRAIRRAFPRARIDPLLQPMGGSPRPGEDGLIVVLAPDPRGGWDVRIRGPAGALGPYRIRSGPPAHLVDSLVDLLSPPGTRR